MVDTKTGVKINKYEEKDAILGKSWLTFGTWLTVGWHNGWHENIENNGIYI